MGKKQARIDKLERELAGAKAGLEGWKRAWGDKCDQRTEALDRNTKLRTEVADLRSALEAEIAKPKFIGNTIVGDSRDKAEIERLSKVDKEQRDLLEEQAHRIGELVTQVAKLKEFNAVLDDRNCEVLAQNRLLTSRVKLAESARLEKVASNVQLNLEVGALQKQLRETRNELTELRSVSF